MLNIQEQERLASLYAIHCPEPTVFPNCYAGAYQGNLRNRMLTVPRGIHAAWQALRDADEQICISEGFWIAFYDVYGSPEELQLPCTFGDHALVQWWDDVKIRESLPECYAFRFEQFVALLVALLDSPDLLSLMRSRGAVCYVENNEAVVAVTLRLADVRDDTECVWYLDCDTSSNKRAVGTQLMYRAA